MMYASELAKYYESLYLEKITVPKKRGPRYILHPELEEIEKNKELVVDINRFRDKLGISTDAYLKIPHTVTELSDN
jgi:hypothetical protein